MNKVLGIVAEYNPFHNGHLYHIEKSKKLSNADLTICIMSGNFTQRGEPAIIDKWSRTKMALEAGIDLVIELPLIYSISSAENFAYGSINILNKLGIVDAISFGSEAGDINILNSIADILHNQPKEYVSLLNHELSKGVSYPKAQEKAVLMYLGDIRRYANVLSSPNNILGIEYLKAIKRIKSNIFPITIKRDSEHNSTDLSDGSFVSSMAIRKDINKISKFKNYVPQFSYDILDDQIKHGKIVKSIATFEKEIIYKLRTMSKEEIMNLPDVTEGLENSIISASNSCNNLLDLISLVKSKRYTRTRIQRILLYALLGITKQDMINSKKISPYVRILGVNENGKKILSIISNSKLNIITSPKQFLEQNGNNKVLKNLLLKDINATNIYTIGYEYESLSNLDFTTPIINI